MSTPRTFKLGGKPMKGNDIELWEKDLKKLFDGIGIDAPIVPNGTYGEIDRSYTKSFAYAIGLDALDILDGGISGPDRTLLRNWRKNMTPDQQSRMDARRDWRRRLRDRYEKLDFLDQGDVSLMVQKLITDTWGYHPGIHDGIDLITLPDVPIFAPVDVKVIDVRAAGWWRLGAPTNHALAAKGDGIVQVEVLKTEGPFKKGQHLGFGHMEKAVVKVGDKVKAGKMLGRSGLANAWHIHWMINGGDVGLRGIGNVDPRPALEYTKKHA